MTELQRLLEFDPLSAAERFTGRSYKDDKRTQALGFGLMHESAQRKEKLLSAAGDTTFSSATTHYEDVLIKQGFKGVCSIGFMKRRYHEKWQAWWHDDGLLLCFDTYQSTGVNRATVYYNWRPNVDAPWGVRSSGYTTKDGVWVGNHDAGEALIYKLNRLRQHGTFINPWVERPFLWLLHHGDEHKVKKERQARIELFPEYVRRAITP